MDYLSKKLNVQEIADVDVEGIDYKDYPDFCDAYIESAIVLDNGVWRDATENELDILSEDRDFVYEQVQNYLY
jgi:hypothetical protein